VAWSLFQFICRQLTLRCHALLSLLIAHVIQYRWMRTISHALQLNTVIGLLQPAPEVYALFDDVLLLTDGCAMRAVAMSTLHGLHAAAAEH
jgi:hypothetical protein